MLSGAEFGNGFIYLKTDIIRFHYKLNNGLITTLNTN